MDLQNVFYTMGIIYMSIMFILMIVTVIAVLVIKHKVHMIQKNIEEKISSLTNAIHVGEAVVDKAKAVFGHKKA
jgi:quinol-cytochrome oxidoreductase complex cytochrome b subunit